MKFNLLEMGCLGMLHGHRPPAFWLEKPQLQRPKSRRSHLCQRPELKPKQHAFSPHFFTRHLKRSVVLQGKKDNILLVLRIGTPKQRLALARAICTLDLRGAMSAVKTAATEAHVLGKARLDAGCQLGPGCCLKNVQKITSSKLVLKLETQ